MGGKGQAKFQGRNWRRRALLALAILGGLFLIFHRPVLLAAIHRIVLHQAAKENLKLEFQLEGSVFTSLTIRNLHARPVGPSDVESIDVDVARIDYGLFSFLRHGLSTAIRDVEVNSARVVMNPAKAPLRPRPPNPKKKIELPDIFPGRLHVVDATIIVRNRPHDFIAEHIAIDLDPSRTGKIKVAKLQLVGGQTWLDLTTPATYSNRKLVVRNLVLADNERFESITLDASQIATRQLAIKSDYRVAEGNLSTSVRARESQGSLDTDVRITGGHVPIDALNKFFALPEGWMSGHLDKIDLDISGLASSPATWVASIAMKASKFQQEQTRFDQATLQLSATRGIANLTGADVRQSKNEFHLRGSAELPKDIHDFGRTPVTVDLAASIPDLKQVTAAMAQPVSGAAEITGKLNIRNSTLDADLKINAPSLKSADGKCDNFVSTLHLSKKIPQAGSDQPWFSDLVSNGTLSAANIQFHDYLGDSVDGSFHTRNDALTFDRLLIKRKQNELALSGDYELPKALAHLGQQAARIDISLNAPQLADYWAENSPDKISGPVQASGQIESRRGIANGQFSLYGTNLRQRDLVFAQLNAQCQIWNNVVYLNDLSAKINDHDFVSANGSFELGGTRQYRGKVVANVTDLSKLKPLLRSFGNENELAGSFQINWQGEGQAVTASQPSSAQAVAPWKNSGTLHMALDNGRYGNARSLLLTADAHYSPEGLDIPTIFLRSDKMDFQAIAQAKGETFEISKIELNQGQAKYASGYVSIPFVWKNLGTDAPVLPSNGKVTATFQSENLDIKKLFQDVGLKPAASGTVNVKLNASGTLADLNARLDLQMRDLRSESLPKFEPASFDLSAQAQGKQLKVIGKLQQAKIQPLELTANLPFDVPKIARDRGLADDTPVTARMRLPRSSVNFLRQFIPGVDELDGDAALDVDVRGTIGQPVLSGSGDMTVNVARMTDPTLPAVQNFKARIQFANNALTLQQFGGELSGGRFTVTGGISFPKLTSPSIDLRLKADSALIARNETLTARADADIKIAGPVTAASVNGTIAMTNSQFLKNLDLLPIGLPGRPPPQPPASRPAFSIPQPPLRDWKFDVTIKTKDPILIRGNLANGKAITDVHLTGTGLHPALDGWVRLENVDATLPFSRLEIASGFLYFEPTDPLNPKIDIHGTSVIRDYTIHVYVYGNSLAPEAIFTSEPPLPQEEIISLLATGTTREELTGGNNNVLAGRAATLLVQQLYRKFFKKGQGTQSTSVFDRLDLDLGTVDPRTGQQQAIARFKVNDQFVLLGDLGVGGDYRGMVKYLIRFR